MRSPSEIPATLVPYKRTAEFGEASIPKGLLRRHSTRAGVWARITLLEGTLRYRILEPEVEVCLLTPERPGVVEPQVPHQVEPVAPVRFYVEFLR